MLLLLLSRFSRVPTLCNPIDGSPEAPLSLGFSRQEHWSELPFPSPVQESEVKGKSLSRVRLLATPWTPAYRSSLSMGFSRQEYWSGVPLPSPMDCIVHGILQARILEWVACPFLRDLPNPDIKP